MTEWVNTIFGQDFQPLFYVLIFWPLFLLMAYDRMQTYLMFYQQEEYDSVRFIAWIKRHRAWDKVASLGLGAAIMCTLFSQFQGQHPIFAYLEDASIICAVVGLIGGVIKSRGNRQSSKKPLVRTERVARINRNAVLLLLGGYLLLTIGALSFPNGTRLVLDSSLDSWMNPLQTLDWRITGLYLAFLLGVQLTPVFLMGANKFLEPYEARVQARFLAEAKAKFALLQPTVIAITGSFGKTSTKTILQHILSSVHPTLATPGSVNTEMGITRVIREQLNEDHSYFIVEMGAYGPGSIAKLCRLTPPDVGLITAVGAAHYERFKTLETVASAKFELASATAMKQADNPVIINTDGIPSHLLDPMTETVRANYIRAGKEGALSVASLDQKEDGLHLIIAEEDQEHKIFVPLYGPHQVENILSAIAVARSLGLPFSVIRASLKSLPQIRHRTEVDRSGPIATVNDAYNSNPIGFEGALIALNAIVKPEGRRILVTPGMVELGAKHDEEHKRLGVIAAQQCDVILVVTPSRIPTFVAGIKGVNKDHLTLIEFSSQAEAEAWVRTNVRAGDAVLYENNLPDLYESPPSF
ncbi:UDP-N-acetylmuramoyl-tripeptide--D-alanyl-D-alanine ligase [Temperatibacter marinus]|uniref:UDP-N-acetylmuramoyl-tripeptide--D-alanyl-D-alanine ligase n=1 Tax=Temperatibacter marinus TaxID=1456591 RepID=A0AA52EJF0_9PROT|nr:UDP-N-acetylmuramoyl-tripeptide--D-alanyl-D-alanine ligase [Temperatibacter marinus]WND03604.1 UDP-N-acetylmuramoyl-tripeptide--D-alanyl-D-alanine ligase [Temperatibacter marinus]